MFVYVRHIALQNVVVVLGIWIGITSMRIKRIRSSKRAQAIKAGYRSGLEELVAQRLTQMGINYGYEDTKLQYTVPAKVHKYTPDFRLRDGVFLETKGIWSAQDRQKHLLIKEQHPDKRILIIFEKPHNKINRASKTTYADFCDKHNIPYISVHDPIPEEYLVE